MITSEELVVRDPSRVEVREPTTGVTVVPSGAATAPARERAPDERRLVRMADGSLRLRGPDGYERVVVSTDGRTAPVSDVRIEPDEIRARYVTDARRKHSGPVFELATPRDNVVVVREREDANGILGGTFLASGLITATVGGVLLFAPGVEVGKGEEKRPITPSERAWIGGSVTTLGAAFIVAGAALLLRGTPSREVYPRDARGARSDEPSAIRHPP